MSSNHTALKQACYEANMELNALGLVVYTFGNVSAVDRNQGVFAIKPSGVPYKSLKAEDIVILDFDNTIVCYDHLFYQKAIELGLVSKDIKKNKSAIRDHIRICHDDET